ncbi:MAG TPA: hypothetical protein VFE50_15605, partial [Cyclobacteriaceae bacterium]|nr:hypothetical protein [Cyclobacteriaceae bacterium]
MKLLYSVVLVLVAFITNVVAQPTDFDATRGDQGTKKLGFNFPGNGAVFDMVADNSDNLYVIGYGYNGANNDVTIAKIGPTGALVASYGVNGIATFRPSHGDDAGRAGIIDGSGNLIVAGSTQGDDGQPRVMIMKLNSNGQLVDGFGDHGVMTLPGTKALGAATGIVSDGLGNFIVSAYNVRYITSSIAYNQIMAFKINANGALVTSFGTNGIFTIEINNNEVAYDLTVDVSSNIYLAGYFTGTGGPSDMGVVKLDANGQLVAGFGSGGKARVDIAPGKSDAAFNVDLDNANNIIISGYTTTTTAQRSGFAKIGQDGVLIDGFGDHGVTVLDNKLIQGTKDDGSGNLFFAAAQGNELAAGKLNMTTGLLVTAFGGGDGVASTLFNADGSNGNGIWIYNNGFVAVAGNGSNFEVARFNTSGVLDVAFNTTGKVIVPVGGKADNPVRMLYDNSGNLYIAGASTQEGAFDPVSTFSIAKFTSAGAIDNTFDGDGRLNFNFNGLLDDERPRDMIFDASGNLLIAGDSYQSSIGPQMAIAKVNPSTGALVTAFGTNGKKIISSSPGYSQITRMALDASGNIIGVGFVTVASTNDVMVVKMDANGNLLSGFGTGGKKIIPQAPAYEEVAGVKVLSDGSILIGGHKHVSDSNIDIMVLKLTAAGELDPTFGTNGVVTTAVGAGNSFDYANDMAVDASGNIYIAVSFTYDYSSPAIIKYKPNGQLATDFGKDGISTFKLDSKATVASVSSIVLASDGYIYLSGVCNSANQNNRTAYVARLNMDGTLTSGYGQDGVYKLRTDDGQQNYIIENATGITMATQDDGDFLVAWLKKGPGLTFPDVTVQLDAEQIAVQATTPGTGAITYALAPGETTDIGLNATTGVVTIRKGGTYNVVAKVEATAQFASASETAVLTLNKVPQTITFDVGEKSFGDEPFS